MEYVQRSRREIIWPLFKRLLIYVMLILIATITVGPFLYMMSMSLRPGFSYMYFPISLIPEEVGLDNYRLLFRQTMMARWILNSLFVAVNGVLLHLVTSSLAGYAFARGEFVGRDFIFWLFMGTLMVPATVTIVPMFVLMSKLKWVDTFYALIVPGATSIFGTFLMRQYFKTIPRDYDDAALMDGANRFDIYWRVILPLAKPAMATLGTLTFLGRWNWFLYPLIMTSSEKMRVLTVGLATMVVQSGGAGFRMAGATVTFLPTFFFFLFMQRHVVQGISLSGMTGV